MRKYALLFMVLLIPKLLSAELFPFVQAAEEKAPLNNIHNPAYLPFSESFFGEVKYSNPYSIDDLYNYSFLAGYGFGNLAIAFRWEHFGIKTYSEDSFDIMGGISCFKYFSIGYGSHILRLKIDSESSQFKHVTTGHNLALGFFPAKFLFLGIYQENIYTLYKKERSDLLPAYTSAGGVLSPFQGVFFSWNYQKTYYGKIQTWQLSTNLLPRFTIKAGYSRQISTYGFSSVLYLAKIKVNYTFRYHAFLGKTHLFSVAWNGRDVFLEPINYNIKKNIKRVPKIDIQKCSLQQLKDINGLNELYAVRIIKYRDLFKFVSEKSLIQLGLPSKQIKLLKRYTKGYIKKERKQKGKFLVKKKRRRRKILSKDKTKVLFIKLVKAGISYPKAFEIAKKAAFTDYKILLKEILKSNEFTANEKRTIKKLWHSDL